jgi:hypothetical protein
VAEGEQSAAAAEQGVATDADHRLIFGPERG